MALTKVPSNLDATVAITQSASDNSTNVATTAYVDTAITNLIDGAPGTLNTLDEIAAALNDDAALNTTLTTSIATKLPLAGGTMTGTLAMGSNAITSTGTISSGAITSSGAISATEYDLPSGGQIDWDGGDARIIEGLVNNYSLSLQTYDGSNLTTALRLDGDNTAYFAGKVGIGTDSPAKLLHLSESADGSKLRITRAGVSEWDFSIGNTSTLTGVGAGALEILPQNSGTANELAIGTAGSAVPLVHITNSKNYFKNNVGIGTDSPGDISLKVHSNDSDDYIAIFKQNHASNLGTVQIDTPSDSNARPSRLDFARGGVNKWKTGMVYGDSSNGWGLSDATGSGTALQQTRFLVQPGGQVMIGHTSSFAHTDADNLAIGDGTSNSGLTIYTGGDKESSIIFGNNGTNGNIEAGIKYYHESHGTVANRRAMTFGTGGNMQERMRIDSTGRVGIGVSSSLGNLLTIAHTSHGIGFDYVGSTLPSIAGLFTSSIGMAETAYGDLNIKARTDYGGYYGIGFFTSVTNSTPRKAMAITSSAEIEHHPSTGSGLHVEKVLPRVTPNYPSSGNPGTAENWYQPPRGESGIIHYGNTNNSGGEYRCAGFIVYSAAEANNTPPAITISVTESVGGNMVAFDVSGGYIRVQNTYGYGIELMGYVQALRRG